MLKIWGRLSSVNVQKVVWCADELGLAYERVDAGGSFGLTKTPEYLGMNPNSLVPVIEDEGFVLYESNAIVRYPRGALLEGRAMARRPRASRGRGPLDGLADQHLPAGDARHLLAAGAHAPPKSAMRR